MSVSLDSRGLYNISPSDWPVLRDLYEQNWPENILSYYTLQNYIQWLAKNPAMNDVHVYSVDEKWREHGTYILEDRNKLRYNVLFNTLSPENQPLMLAALRRLELEPAYTLTAYVERVKPAALQHLREVGTTDFMAGYCPTRLYYLPKEQSLLLKLNSLQAGFVIKPLSNDLVDNIDNIWPHQYPGSNYFIRRLIRYNLTFGIFKAANNELCAWVMHLQLGAIGLLQVEEKYKRRGFGVHLVCLLARKLAELGLDATATVMDTNLPSVSLFEKLGFRVIDQVYWFDKLAVEPSVAVSLRHG